MELNAMTITHWIIEGGDRLGKSSLISRIDDEFGYHIKLHYEKPKMLKKYTLPDVVSCDNKKQIALQTYQYVSFKHGFKLLATDIPTIYDRFHLGENVYAPMYRGYRGDYVYKLEYDFDVKHLTNTRLILLTTSNFDIITDDGLGFDFSKKEEEQRLFVDAFNISSFSDKRIIDVHDGNGNYKSYDEVFDEATL